MDMSDKIVAGSVDELERDRELLRSAGGRPDRLSSFRQFAGSSVGLKLKLMFGAAAGAAGVLGFFALFGLAGSNGSDGLLLTMTLIAVVVAAMAGLAIRFVQVGLVHPLEEVCSAMRELAEGNREQRLNAYRELRDQLSARIRDRFGRTTGGNE